MDYGAIGEAWAFGSVMKRANEEARDWIDWSQREVAHAKARGNAQDAGRRAQIRLLVDALEKIDPGHPALAETGLRHPDGSVELRYHRVFDKSYDDVAIKAGIPLCTKAVSPAEAARLAVMREPVTMKRVFLMRTWWWRGDQYRSERGALEARKRAAEKAALEVDPVG
jgi:hypothetical protein